MTAVGESPPATVPGNGAPAHVSLPVATKPRWQPIRGGLLNLFRYDYEEFRYEDGHLLLRGNNGTGKSRVLALQLPFLLDGEVTPARVEPDGDRAKRIEWNLLMDRYKDRVGYTWLEFGRKDPDGAERYLTIGCGLSAVEGRPGVIRWFFITPLRVGSDLFLKTPSGHPLSKEALERALSGHGEVLSTVKAYRSAVNSALFNLGEHRYLSLVNLLIQLRQPQLSRQLDENRLSHALSEALQPLPESIVADVAESFRSLEADRDELARFEAAERSVARFLDEYRRYARIAAFRRSEAVRKAHSAYENTTRNLRVAQDERGERITDKERIEASLRESALEIEGAKARIQTLEQSPEMRDAQALDRAIEEARRAAEQADRAAQEVAHAGETRAGRERDLDDAEQDLEDARDEYGTALAVSKERAEAAGLRDVHHRAVDRLSMGHEDEEPQKLQESARASIRAGIGSRRSAIAHVRGLVERVTKADQELQTARKEEVNTEERLERAREAERNARDELETEGRLLEEAFRRWTTSLVVLAVPDLDLACSSLETWLETGERECPVTMAVRDAMRTALERIAAERSARRQQLETLERHRSDLAEEELRLRAGGARPPPVPHTRSEVTRAGRLGAPLWQLCDFAAHVEADVRANIEAALEASGLLDAWVMPDGSLLAQSTHDTLLSTTGAAPFDGQHLGTMLVPAIDRKDPATAEMTEETVSAVLRCIGAQAGAGTVWVDARGSFRLGPLYGSWTKLAAEHVGEGARAAARRQRLEQIVAEIESVDAEITKVRAALDDIEARSRMAREEVENAPTDEAVRNAFAKINAAVSHVAAVRIELEAAQHRAAACRSAMTERTRECEEAAQDLGLAGRTSELAAVETAVNAYEVCLATLWAALRDVERAGTRTLSARKTLAEARDSEKRLTQTAQELEIGARQAACARDALQETVGASSRQVREALGEARKALGDHERKKEDLQENLMKVREKLAALQEKISGLEHALEGATAERSRCIESLSRLAATNLLATAHEELSDVNPTGWSTTGAVEVARRVDRILRDVDASDAAWDRNQSGIHRYIQELTSSLVGEGYPPETTFEDDILVVTAPFRGNMLSMSDLRQALVSETIARRTLLDAREREVIEDHLLGDVAAHLHDLLHRAKDLVREINAEIESRPMSTGMTLRFQWEIADDVSPELPAARECLMRAPALWSPEQRKMVATFLQKRIADCRLANDTGTWQEHLTNALDYRSWHRFSVERQQDGRWRRLTKRTHGTGSGGEKAIALTLPQFAAAAAHYRSADPNAPRLILLDEAFVGVDSDMRSKCMGLLAAFDLDFVMTSEREWGCYSTLPGVAIYQLATRPGIDAVAVTRWVWNGRERVQDHTRLPSASPPQRASSPRGNTLDSSLESLDGG